MEDLCLFGYIQYVYLVALGLPDKAELSGTETITNSGFIGSSRAGVYRNHPHAGADKSLDITTVPYSHTDVSKSFFVRCGKQTD